MKCRKKKKKKIKKFKDKKKKKKKKTRHLFIHLHLFSPISFRESTRKKKRNRVADDERANTQTLQSQSRSEDQLQPQLRDPFQNSDRDEQPHALHPGGKYYPYPEGNSPPVQSPPVMSGAIGSPYGEMSHGGGTA